MRITGFLILFAAANAASAQPAAYQQTVTPLLKKYCYACHGNGAKNGGVALDTYRTPADVDKDKQTWETVLHHVQTHEMPPENVKIQPTAAERDIISNWIEAELYKYDPKHPDPGRVTMRRLNRAEYNNTIRDLIGVDFHPADDFPADNSGYGFDDIGDVLSLPPVLMEKYLAAANTILDKAIATQAVPSRTVRYKANLMEVGFNADGDRGDGWMPLTALEEDELAMRVPFAGGDYTIRVQAFNKGRGATPEPTILTCMVDNTIVTDWKVTAVEASPGVYEARIGVPEGRHRIAVLNHRIRGGKNELQMRNGRIGAQQPGTIWVKWVELEGPVKGASKIFPATNTAKFTVPKEGDYILRAEAYAQQAGPDPAKMEFQIDGKPIAAFDVLAPADMKAIPGQQVFSTELLKAQPRIYEFRAKLTPGAKIFSTAFTNPFADPENTNPNLRVRKLHVDRLEVVGVDEASPIPPLPDPMRRLLSKKPNARAILTEFATRAWRRPVQPAEVNQLMALFDPQAPFETAIKQPMKAVLVSPYFLFHDEVQPVSKVTATSEPIGEIALASRLSYFLWSSMPDDELLGLAERNQLRANLDAQVKRMLASPKAQALVENFAGQWLEIRNLKFIAPDKTLYPDFDESLRDAMEKETELFFASVMHEDRSVIDFVNGNYTFVNERLARHYGIPNISGPEFRKVSLEGTPRRGVLTQASVLTLTSNPTRTSPVKRGKWVLEDLLGTPPPPPPPDVPPLKEDAKGATGTLRQQMEEHRANPVCASCHARMDPIGFSLENFDGIGAYRTKEGQFPIDPSGKLTSGEFFQGASELSNILATSKRDQFVRCLTEKMMIYALGRGLEYYDRAATDQIMKAAEKNQYKFSSLVLGVVKSMPFEQRRAGDAETEQ
jgi:mono/diheme cytochrome c family protein